MVTKYPAAFAAADMSTTTCMTAGENLFHLTKQNVCLIECLFVLFCLLFLFVFLSACLFVCLFVGLSVCLCFLLGAPNMLGSMCRQGPLTPPSILPCTSSRGRGHTEFFKFEVGRTSL